MSKLLMNNSLSRTFRSNSRNHQNFTAGGEAAIYLKADAKMANNGNVSGKQSAISTIVRTREIELQNKALAQHLQQVN